MFPLLLQWIKLEVQHNGKKLTYGEHSHD